MNSRRQAYFNRSMFVMLTSGGHPLRENHPYSHAEHLGRVQILSLASRPTVNKLCTCTPCLLRAGLMSILTSEPRAVMHAPVSLRQPKRHHHPLHHWHVPEPGVPQGGCSSDTLRRVVREQAGQQVQTSRVAAQARDSLRAAQ